MAALFVVGCMVGDAEQITASCAPDPGMTVTHGHITGMERAMSLMSSIRSGARPPLNQDRSGDASTSPPTGHVEAGLPLPRHLLVALAGIAADVTSLQQRFVDDPQLHEPLDRILGRLDDLVDSIYEQAADSRAHPVDASSGHGSAISADHPAAAIAVRPGAASTARSSARLERSLPGHPS